MPNASMRIVLGEGGGDGRKEYGTNHEMASFNERTSESADSSLFPLCPYLRSTTDAYHAWGASERNPGSYR
jgi:hypothetical protein